LSKLRGKILNLGKERMKTLMLTKPRIYNALQDAADYSQIVLPDHK